MSHPPLLALVVLLGAAAACSSTSRADATRIPSKPADISLFFTAELKGTLEPCGCTSDPLGDIARTARAVGGAGRKAALFDGGSTLYLESPIPPEKQAQAELTADAVARILPGLSLAGAGLGPFDLAAGADKVRFARQAANVSGGVPLAPPAIVDVGGVSVGVFGVVAPRAVPGLKASDPAAAARQAIADLRGKGATIVVALAHMPRADARRLARDAPGADFMLVGQDLPDNGVATPDVVGTTFLLMPGNRGQVLTRVDLHVDGGGPFVDAVGPDRAEVELATLAKRIATLEKDLARWKKDPSAEAAFVKNQERDLAAARRDRAALARQPLRAPPSGSWFVVRPLRVTKKLPCDPATVAEKRALDAAIGEANRKLAATEKPLAPEAGKPGYAGIEECGYCHKAAVAFWKKTHHANAWETLEKVGKQWNRDCIVCHVTGWQEPGGASFAKHDGLRDVQCEACHGPASIHVDEDGKDKPRTIALAPAEDLCASRCHTPEHSDTFQREAYLRDILGPGHGARARRALGDGPTGFALRKAALEKAGRGIGANCVK